jgi:hypothetical protein
LFSQAGVAIGLALAASHELERFGADAAELGHNIIAIITATTFIVQLVGPPFIKYAIVKAGEAKAPAHASGDAS